MFQYSKRAIILTIYILFSVLCPLYSTEGRAQNFIGKKEQLSIAKPLPSLEVGEKLQYTVEWLGIVVGLITLDVQGVEVRGGRECFHVVARAQPNKLLAKLHDIEYTVHTYIDKENLYPLHFEKIRRLRDKFNHTEIDFDHKNHTAKYQSSGTGPSIVFSPGRPEVENGVAMTFEIPPGAQDLLSSLYYFRLMKVDPDHSYSLNIYYGSRNWPVAIKAEEPFLKDIRKKGVFAAFKASIASKLSQSILGKSQLVVFFTADSRRIPLEFRLGTGLGPITGFIQQIEAVE